MAVAGASLSSIVAVPTGSSEVAPDEGRSAVDVSSAFLEHVVDQADLDRLHSLARRE